MATMLLCRFLRYVMQWIWLLLLLFIVSLLMLFFVIVRYMKVLWNVINARFLNNVSKDSNYTAEELKVLTWRWTVHRLKTEPCLDWFDVWWFNHSFSVLDFCCCVSVFVQLMALLVWWVRLCSYPCYRFRKFFDWAKVF
jgi:hypothetical protein